MSRTEAIIKMDAYLKLHNIPHQKDIDMGCQRYTMMYRSPASPGGYVESCIWFYLDGYAEVRMYYNKNGAEICKKSNKRDDLIWLINYINANVFLRCQDPSGLYEATILYTPRLYMTTDGCYDITITTILNYDIIELAPVETLDYMTAYCPELLDGLAPPIFGVLRGKQSLDEAINYIDTNIVND